MNTNAQTLPAGGAPSVQQEATVQLGSVLRYVLGAAIAGVWCGLAFVGRSSPLHRAVVALIVSGVVYMSFSACTYLATRGGQREPGALDSQLSRCALATMLLALILPEYMARVQPSWVVSALLGAVCVCLWAALFALTVSRVRPSPRVAIATTAVMLCLLTGVSTALALRKYQVFGYVGQDLAYFGQIVYSTTHGHVFRGSLLQDLLYSKPVATDFAGHNSPVMFLLVPFYWLWPSPATLIVLRNLLLLLGTVPIYLLARRRTSVFVACLWVVVFFVTPSILLQNIFDFYPLTLAAVPLLFSVYFFVEGRYAAFLVACAAALLVREDLGFAICLFSVAAVWERRTKKWVLAPAAAGVAWLVLSFNVVLPVALHGAHFVTDACFGHLGSSPAAMLANVLQHPKHTLLIHGNLVYLKTLLSPTGLLLGVASPVAWLAAPLLAINLAAGGGPCTTTMIAAQYSVVPATMLFAGALLAATGKGRTSWLARAGRLGLADPAAPPLLLMACCIATLLFTSPEADGMAFQHRVWEPEAYRVLSMIPANASVAGPRYMLPHLANRDCLYQTHRLEEYHHPVYEYLIVDNDWSDINAASIYRAEYEHVAASAAVDPNLQLLYASAQFRVYRNPQAAGVSCWREQGTEQGQVHP